MKQFLFEAEPNQITSFSATANRNPDKLHRILMTYFFAFQAHKDRKVCTACSNNAIDLLEPSPPENASI